MKLKFNKDGELYWKDEDGDKLLVTVNDDQSIFLRTYHGIEAGIVAMSRKKALKFAEAIIKELM